MQDVAWLQRLRESRFLAPARLVRHPMRTARAARAARWARSNAVDVGTWASSIDRTLWEEAVEFGSRLRDRHSAHFDELRRRYRVGGGGEWVALHFLVRLHQPAIAVETGVAAGWSSAAILHAMHLNGFGHLHSSELPYQRPSLLDDYRPLVGAVVDEELRERWTLHLGSDRDNLPKIVGTVPESIGLLHYDSDKSESGRKFALSLLRPHLADGATVMFDDIQDDLHFRSTVEALGVDHTILGPVAKAGLFQWRDPST